MLSAKVEERFNIATKLIIEYAISFPIILPDEERIFTFSWETIEDSKIIVVHDLYSRNIKTGIVTHKVLKDYGTKSKRLKEEVVGYPALALEEEYNRIYEESRDNWYNTEYQDKNEINKKDLREIFFTLIVDEALLAMYKKYGGEMLWSDGK